MTVTAAPPSRTVVDLGADATVLDAAARLAATQPGQDVVLVVPAGAPLVRNALFLEVLRRRTGDRRLTLVSADARARSLAASVHLRAFASLAALERHELDSTERLGDARRAALATIAAVGARRGVSFGRGLAVLLSLLLAAGILTGVVAPSATVVVAPAASAIGPFEYDLRAGPGGEINDALTLGPATLTKKVAAPATGSETVDIKATGAEKFTNLTTSDIKIPKGTIVQTPDGIRFETIEEKTLGRSFLQPIFVTTATIFIAAIDPGPKGNVPADRITRSPTPDYAVTNPSPTTNGESRKIAVVTQADYDTAAASANTALRVEADATLLKKWQQDAPKNRTVYGTWVQQTAITAAADVVGKKLDAGVTTFDLTVTGNALGYSVLAVEPQQTALKKLAEAAAAGNQIDTGGRAKVNIIIPATVDDKGVHWRVQASSIQYARTAPLASALAGKSVAEATRIAKDRGFQVSQIVLSPTWLPLMPLLDSRITVTIGDPTAVANGP